MSHSTKCRKTTELHECIVSACTICTMSGTSISNSSRHFHGLLHGACMHCDECLSLHVFAEEKLVII